MGVKMYKWPPKMADLGDIVKKYIDDGNPLSISSDTGIYSELESKFAKIIGRKYALAVSSGTMALYSAFFSIGIEPGDEIICTSFSFHATVSTALFWGANIVFCDVEPDTGNINADLIEERITKKTKAILTNDQWGHPCNKERILELCRKYSIKYVEDCSHAHLSKYKDNYCGSFGDVSCWSFQGSKMINGGEGGILATDSFSIYERAVLLGHYSWRSINTVETNKYKPINNTGFGLKLRMHPLAAVIILHEIEHYAEKWIVGRRDTLTYFEKQLEEKTPLKSMTKKDYVSSMGAWYGFYPRIDYSVCKKGREHFINYLKKNNIQVVIPTNGILPYLPLFKNEEFHFYQNDRKNDNQVYEGAELYINSIIGFPTFSNYEYDEIDRYVAVISKYFEENM